MTALGLDLLLRKHRGRQHWWGQWLLTWRKIAVAVVAVAVAVEIGRRAVNEGPAVEDERRHEALCD